jgi:phage terminase small subunit
MKPRFTIKQQRFVQAYKTSGNINEAARKAGYSVKNRSLSKILASPPVLAELEKHKQEVIASGRYGYEKAMKECEEAMIFSRETENAAALVKAIELKTKLSGLMIEKHEVKQVGFSVVISGVDANLPTENK